MDIEQLRAKRYWSEVEGRRAVELWRKSGESLSAFAARTGVRGGRIAYWDSRVGVPAPMVLAPVTVVRTRRATTLSVELRSGRAIKIEGDFDDDVLARLIVIAERAGC